MMCRRCPGCEIDNQDVRGYFFCTPGRTILFISFLILNVAILEFGYRDAGCRRYNNLDDTNFDDAELGEYYEKGWSAEDGGKPETCKGKTHGANPVSLIPLIGVIGGLSSAVLMPLAGSIVDATDQRLNFGRASAMLLVLTNAVLIFIDENNWFAMVVLQATINSFSYMALALVVHAYLPELTNNLEELTRICSLGRFYDTAAMLGLIVVATGGALALDLGVIDAARLAQALAVVIGGPFCAVGLGPSGYTPRKRNRDPRPGYGFFLDGVMQICDQWRSLRDEFPDCGLFLLGVCFFEAATGTVTIAAILLLVLNGMPLTMIGPYLAVVMIFMLFGPFLNVKLAKKLGLKRNFMAVLGAFIFGLLLFALVIRDALGCWILAPFIGIIYGWYYSAQSTLFASLIPASREAETSGLSMFCSMVLSWVPSLVLTAGSESGHLRLSVAVLPLFWAIGMFICHFIDTERAKQVVARDGKGGAQYEVDEGAAGVELEASSTTDKSPTFVPSNDAPIASEGDGDAEKGITTTTIVSASP
jgi:MFS-type transporter involved in bile tolerance (Atg22 family)